MRDFSIKRAFFCARTEFVKWLFDARMIIVAILIIFINSFVVAPLRSNAALMGEPMNILEPFIATANSGVILMIIPLVFLTLIADFPALDSSSYYYIYRTGRVNWLTGQILKLVFMGVFYLAVIFAGSVLPIVSNSFVYNKWSNVVTKFRVTFPEQKGNFGLRLLPENLYNQMDVTSAAVESYLLVFAYLMIIGLVLLAFSLIRKKNLGFAFCGAVISAGMALCSFRSQFMWTMPMANSIIWLHYTEYLQEPVYPMMNSVIYLCSVIAVLVVFCYCMVSRINYDNINEVMT